MQATNQTGQRKNGKRKCRGRGGYIRSSVKPACGGLVRMRILPALQSGALCPAGKTTVYRLQTAVSRYKGAATAGTMHAAKKADAGKMKRRRCVCLFFNLELDQISSLTRFRMLMMDRVLQLRQFLSRWQGGNRTSTDKEKEGLCKPSFEPLIWNEWQLLQSPARPMVLPGQPPAPQTARACWAGQPCRRTACSLPAGPGNRACRF